MSQHIEVGGVKLDVTVDLRARVARIGANQVSLREANVVLVDNADTPNPTIAGTIKADPELPAADRFQAVIQRVPELRDFVQCDAQFADLAKQNVAKALCAETLDRRK